VVPYLVYVVCVMLSACRGSTIVEVQAKHSIWVHQAALLGFPPHRVGLMLMACRAHLYSWRVGHCMVCAVERPRRLVYLFLTRVRVLRHRFTFLSWHKYRCSEPPIPRTHLV
jgi:hypothetical protein